MSRVLGTFNKCSKELQSVFNNLVYSSWESISLSIGGSRSGSHNARTALDVFFLRVFFWVSFLRFLLCAWKRPSLLSAPLLPFVGFGFGFSRFVFEVWFCITRLRGGMLGLYPDSEPDPISKSLYNAGAVRFRFDLRWVLGVSEI